MNRSVEVSGLGAGSDFPVLPVGLAMAALGFGAIIFAAAKAKKNLDGVWMPPLRSSRPVRRRRSRR